MVITIFELTLVGVAVLGNEATVAVIKTILPHTDIYASTGKDLPAIAIHFIIEPVSFEDRTIFPDEFTATMAHFISINPAFLFIISGPLAEVKAFGYSWTIIFLLFNHFTLKFVVMDI